MRRIYQRDCTAKHIYDRSLSEVKRLEKDIKAIEAQMMRKISEDDELAENYRHMVSVKGTGMINAVAILVHTQNFTSFNNSRQFSSYAGMAPFDDSSGTSRNRVSCPKIA